MIEPSRAGQIGSEIMIPPSPSSGSRLLKVTFPFVTEFIMSESLPPPIYSQTDPDENTIPLLDDDLSTGPQILIIPTGDAVNFQKGFLGADGERAAIEGELQIKGSEPGLWAKV